MVSLFTASFTIVDTYSCPTVTAKLNDRSIVFSYRQDDDESLKYCTSGLDIPARSALRPIMAESTKRS